VPFSLREGILRTLFIIGSEMKKRILAQVNDILSGIYALPGGENLSKSFCNWPVSVQTTWIDEPMATVLLCGRLKGHEGDCNPVPPVSDINKENK
jgi:hypothetical protein